MGELGGAGDLSSAHGPPEGSFWARSGLSHCSLLNSFLSVCLKQQFADKVLSNALYEAPKGRYQRKILSSVQPGLSCPVTDAFEHLRVRQREENLLDPNVLPHFPNQVIRCTKKSIWKGQTRPNWAIFYFHFFGFTFLDAEKHRCKKYLEKSKKAVLKAAALIEWSQAD